MDDPKRALFESVVRLLVPVLDELVFVGGCTTGLFITDPAASGIRPTKDVDAIVDVTSYGKYAALADKLRAIGLVEDTTEGAPLCRWVRPLNFLRSLTVILLRRRAIGSASAKATQQSPPRHVTLPVERVFTSVNNRVDEVLNLEVAKLRSELGDVGVAVACRDLQRKPLAEVEEQRRKVIVWIA